jgi:TolB-like protein/DNA-binding winged helix-turn-helix (wHTH) protein
MPISSPSPEPIRFNAFEVNVRAGELRKHGIRIKVQDQPFRVLQVLLEHPGEVVTREELQHQIWPSDTFVDFDRGLNNAVKRLREALADSADEPRYIETIPKRGYRFIAVVEPTNGHKVVEAESPAIPVETARSPEKKKLFLNRQSWKASVAVFFAIALVVVVGLFLRNRSVGKVAAAPIRSIAVLPLQNLSGDPSQEYFADGMTEELITEISRLNDLKVISRTSVMRYKNTHKSLPEIARELNVEAVVEGSVLRSGDRVRITAQLISARTDANLWGESYDRSLQDSLAVQEAVATAIAGKIKTTMSPNAVVQLKPAGTVNLKAHEAYLLGLHESQLGGELANHEGMEPAATEHLRRATEYYQQAIKEDPNYALAYLGLADGSDPNEVEANARRALELDDSLSEAHLEVAAVALARDLNWQGAEKEFLRAVAVNPNYAPAHQGYAYFLDARGKLDDGLREYQRAQELDPANDHLGAALYSRRDYSHLIELEHRALATNPPGDTSANAIAHKVLMVAYARTGKLKESIDEMRSAIACLGFHDFAEEIRRGYVASDYRGALRAYLVGARKRSDWAFHLVDIYAFAELGDYDQAFGQLARLNKDNPWSWQWVTQAEGLPTLASLRVEPMWDPLHYDPRFEELARRVGLPAQN